MEATVRSYQVSQFLFPSHGTTPSPEFISRECRAWDGASPPWFGHVGFRVNESGEVVSYDFRGVDSSD